MAVGIIGPILQRARYSRQAAIERNIIEQRENEMISWRSAPEADVDNAGSVWFSPTAGGAGTLVRLSLKYSPQGGKAGALVHLSSNRDNARSFLEPVPDFGQAGDTVQRWHGWDKGGAAVLGVAAHGTRSGCLCVGQCVQA